MTSLRTAAASLAALAFAAAPTIARSHELQQQTIIVSGQRIDQAEEEVSDRPGGADIVRAEEYADRVAVSLREALAFSPGVYAQPRFGQEVRLSIRGSGLSRGFHMRGLTLLQDGVPINLADDNGDFQELDPLVFQHIQVFRGANALRHGGSTLGGAINAVTPTGRTERGFRGRIDGGSFGTLRGLLAGGYADDDGDAWLAVTADRSKGERDHAERQSLRLNANVGIRLSPVIETRFYASANAIEQELPGALALATVLTRPETGNFAGDQARDVDSLRLQNRTTFHFGAGDLALGGFVNAKELYHPIFQVVDQQSTDHGLFARFDWGTGPLELTLGTTARFGTIDSRRYVNVNGSRGALTLDADQKARTINAYGEARYRSGSVTLIGGGIYTHGVRRQDQFFPAAVSGRAEYDEFSPRLGLLWKLGEQLSLYANYSRSHELPGFGELAQVAAFVSLDPQRAWTWEAGARGQLGIARFDVSVYRARLDGELLQFTVGPDIPASTFNADRTLHQGIEAGLDLQAAPWLRLRQVYQLNDFRFRGDRQHGDNRLPVVPRHLYRAELRLGRDGLNVAPAIEWVPEGAWADYANTLRADGYVLLGVTATVRVKESVDLFLDARNLTAKRAVGDISAVVNYSALAPSQRSIFYPVEQRAVFGGVRARF